MRRTDWIAALALIGLVALGLWASVSDLLPGEHWVAEQLSTQRDGTVGFVATALDEGLNDWGAPVVFALLAGPILARWGVAAVVRYLFAGASTTLLKVVDFVERPRPTAELTWGVYIEGYGGFPSGHVVYVTVLAVTVACLAVEHEAVTWARRAIVCLAAALTVAIGPARLVTNDHWAADAVAGYLTAAVLLVVCSRVTRAVIASPAIAEWVDAQPNLTPSRWTRASSGGASPRPSGSRVKST